MSKLSRAPRSTLVPLALVSLFALVALLAPLVGCGESSYDIYMRGLAQLSRAEKVDCKMLWDPGANAMVINSAKIITCIEANEAARETILEAQAAGFTGKDVDRTLADLDQRIEKLRSRLRVVGYMERDAALQP